MVNFIIILSFSARVLIHPVHLTVTNIDVDTSEKVISGSVRLFPDDLKLAVFHEFEKSISFDSIKDDDTQDAITMYFGRMFSAIDGRDTCKISITDYRNIDNEIFVYFTFRVKKKAKSFDILNALFMDLYFDQKNLMIVSVNGNEKGYEFTYENFKQTIQIE